MANGHTRIEMDALNAVRNIDRKMKDQREIDWEQRRYEIAKDAICAILANSSTSGNIESDWLIRNGICIADALIAELKKGGEK